MTAGTSASTGAMDTMPAPAPAALATAAPPGRWTVYRHRLPVRITHWLNVVCMTVLLGSGLSIFNAHPHLYWGEQSDFERPLLEIVALRGADGQYHGALRVGAHRFDTDGVLGVSTGPSGKPQARAFPTWATLPGPQNLALGRKWHFSFAWLLAINGAAYLLWALGSGHLRRDLAPTQADWRGFGRSVVDHALLRHPQGEQATRYNVLQKLAYLAVIGVLAPGMLLTGLAMSPHFDPVMGWLLDLLGGRQSARTVHFIFAFALLAFVAIHLFELLVAGAVNHVRSMLTGWYDVPGGWDAERPVEEASR